MRTVTFLGAVLAASASPTLAIAQQQGSRMTRDYIQSAGNADAFERDEAVTALAESTDPQILDFAHKMIADHALTTQMLQQATAQAGLAPPPIGVGSDEASLLGALQSSRGPEFDKMYWHHQALQHRAALAMTQMYASTGDNPAVREAANSALPIISAHLAMSEQMVAKSVGS